MNNISLSIVHTRTGRGAASLISWPRLTRAEPSRNLWCGFALFFC